MEIIAAHVELDGNVALDADGSVVEYTTLTLNEGDNLSIVLTKKGTSASHVWDYFGFLCNTSNDTVLDPTNVYCEICFRSKEVRRYGAKTSTGNLGSHLSKKHGIISTKSKGVELSFLKPKKLLLSSASEQKSSRSIRTSIKKTSQVNRLSRDIVTWLARDLLPLDTVEGQGFADFGHQRSLIFGDDKPVFSLLTRASLNELFDWTVEIIRTELENTPKTLAVTFDSWIDNQRQLTYVTYTVHWIDSQWKVKKIPLTTSYFPYPTTTSAVAEDFKEVLIEFGLTERSFVSTTNGGSNTKEACALLGMQHHSCVGHGLHSLLTRDLIEQLGSNELNSALDKMTNIHKVIFCNFMNLHKHAVDPKNDALKELLEYHEQLDDILLSEDRVDIGTEEDSLHIATTELMANGQAQIIQLKKKSCTSWHILLAMIQNYMSHQAQINTILESFGSHESILTDEETEVLNIFGDILEIFKTTSRMLCGEEYATLPLSVLFRTAVIKRIQEDMGDLEFQIRARAILLENVDKWFPLNDINVCAALLDPSMKNITSIEEYLAAKEITNVQLLQSMVSAYGIEEENKECSIEMDLPLDDSQPVWKRLKTDYLKECTATGPHNSLESEIAKYFIFSSKDDEPLKFWKKNEHLFPQLSSLAKFLHSIPAISAPSQRIFSTTGVLGTAKRSMLKPTMAKQILFIHDNYDLASELDKTLGKEKNLDISTSIL